MNPKQANTLPGRRGLRRAFPITGGLLVRLALPGVAALCAVAAPPAARAQEAEAAPTSLLASVPLPAGAVRLKPESVPANVSQALRNFIEAAGPGVKQGRIEVLAWTGGAYKRADAGRMKDQLAENLRGARWSFEEGKADEKGGPITLINAMQTKPTKKAVIGFWIPTDDTLVLAWTEMLPAKAEALPSSEPSAEKPAEKEHSIKAIFDGLVPSGPGPETPPIPEHLKVKEAPTAAAAPSAPGAFVLTAKQNYVNVMKKATPPIPAFPAVTPRAGFVRGYVKDAKGRPIANAVIGVRSSAVGGFYSGASAKTDAKGYYELGVPWGAAEFYTASCTLDYGDGRAAFGLHPADGEADSFASAKGAVENWVLLSYGIADRDKVSENPGYSGNYYGGSFSVSYFVEDPRFPDGKNLIDGSEVEVTLTPDGPLLDGTTGKPITVRRPVRDDSASIFSINNVPVGTYKISARMLRDGKSTTLHLKESGPYFARPFGLDPKEGADTATLTFRPGSAKAGMAAAQHGNWESVIVSLSR